MLPSGWWGRGALSAVNVDLQFHSPGLRHAGVTAITEVDAALRVLPSLYTSKSMPLSDRLGTAKGLRCAVAAGDAILMVGLHRDILR